MRTVVAALGLASAAGINAYATLLVLGLTVRFQLVPFDSEVARFFSQTWVLGVLAVLYAVEFVADKIPAVDHAWDAVHTFIRPLAGAAAAVAVVGGRSEGWVILAAVVGGVTSLLLHGAKATGRVAVTTSTGGMGNMAVSVVEDVAAIGGSLLALLLPVLAVVLFAVLLAWFLRTRSLRRAPGP